MSYTPKSKTNRLSQTVKVLHAAIGLSIPACFVESPPVANPVNVARACAPGDGSWGCQSIRTQEVSTNPGPGTQNLPVQTGATPPTTAPISNGPATNAPRATIPLGSPVPTTLPQPIVSPATPNSTPTLTNPSNVIAEDALGRRDVTFMQNRVKLVVATLIAGLEPSIRRRIDGIPLVFDPSQAEVNAFATCSRTGKPAIAVTDGMLTLTANLAQLKAVDDTFGTRKVGEYTNYVAQYQQANAPLLAPPNTWLTPEQRTNRAVLARQLQIFDEMIAFTFGHELAHHYLNHLPCTSILPLESSELGVLLTDTIPAFNQPNESAADVASVRNILNTTSGNLGYKLTETGGLVQLRFFTALDSARPIDVFTFERTHPPPSLRESIVNSTAQAFRLGVPTSLPWLN